MSDTAYWLLLAALIVGNIIAFRVLFGRSESEGSARTRTINATRPNGRVARIDEYQQFERCGDKLVPTAMHLKLRNGDAVTAVDETTFIVASTGEKLTL